MKSDQIRFAGGLLFVLAIIILLSQAFHPLWAGHLRGDSQGAYLLPVLHLLEHGSLTTMVSNEYQPGAVLFFLSLSPPFASTHNPNVYTTTLILANTLLLLLVAYFFYWRSAPSYSLGIFALILIAMGPTLLYRFDIIVTLFVVWAIYLWQQKKHLFSAVALGVGTAIKLYPVVLVPYFLLLLYKQKQGIKYCLQYVGAFASGGVGVVVLYALLFQASIPQVIADLGRQTLKPVHIEATWGSLLTVGTKLATSDYPLGEGARGIFGIHPDYVIGPLWMYNYAWVAGFILFYAWLFSYSSKKSPFLIEVCIAAIILFLLLAKLISPQYLVWFGLLVPLLSFERWSRSESSILFLILLTMFITQYIYPLRYDALLSFYLTGHGTGMFWVLLLRNVLLIVLFIRFMVILRHKLDLPEKAHPSFV